MRPHILLRRLAAVAVVLAITGPLSGGVANAQTADGTFVPIDAATNGPIVTGSDATIVRGVTGGTCGASPGADGYNGVVSGPGVFAPNPPIRPDGLQVVPTSDLNFSTADPIPFSLRGNFKDFAAELGGTVVPGDYTITIRCVSQFDGVIFQKFSATLRFSSPTSFTVISPAPGTPTPAPPTPTPAPTPATPTPTPPTPTPAPGTPTPATPTPTPAPGTPTASPAPTATPVPNRATSTRLTVFPRKVVAGHPVFLLARVHPGRAAGTIRFADGGVAVADPQRTVFGFAVAVAALDAGAHPLTATFTPANPQTFQASTSRPVTVQVRSPRGGR